MSNPPPGGRGGRGLALLQQMRRPGVAPAATPPAPAAPAAPAPAAPAPAEVPSVAVPEVAPAAPLAARPSAPGPAALAMPVGRGRGAHALLAAKSGAVPPPAAAATTPAPRPQSPASLPHAGRGIAEAGPLPPPGAIPKSLPGPPLAPVGRGGGGRGASGLALLQKKPGMPSAPPSVSDSSSPSSSTTASTAAPSTVASTPPSTRAASTSGSDTNAPTTRAPSTTGSGSDSGTAAPTTRAPSTTGSGSGSGTAAPTTRAASTTGSGSGTGGTSGSGSATTGSGTASGADTLASSVAKIHLSKPRNPPVKKVGDSGKPCPMQTNYIRIKTQASSIYQYHVSFDPAVDARGVRFSLMKQNKEKLGSVMAFDGVILYLPVKLEDPVTVLTGLRKTDNATITIKVQLTTMPSWEEVPKVFNVIFGRVMKALKLVEVGRNKYDNKAAVAVPQHKLEVWPGYVTHINEQEGGVLLMCDASHRVLRNETCLEVMGATFKQTKGGPTFQTECIKQLVGQVVLTRYNNNTYRVDDMDFNQSPKSTFPLRSGGDMSYLDYYKDHYGITIKDHDQPLLIHRPRPPKRAANEAPVTEEEANRVIMLIPELTYLTGMSDAMRADFRVMKDIAVHTRITPDQRRAFLQKFVQRVMGCEEGKSELDGWGLQLEGDIMTLDGRTLPPENIMFGRGYKASAGPTAEWSRDATTKTVLKAVNVTDWVVIFTKRDAQKGADFVDQMKKICPTIGIQIRDPKIVTLNDDRTETYVKEVKGNVTKDVTQLVVTIMPTQRDDRYNAIKKLCYVEQPIASQVVNSKTLDPKKLRSVCQKIALQINCKLGGELWAVDVPIKSLMIVGIDSYHEKNKRGSSVAGFVASINATISRYYSQTCSGSHAGQEMVDKLRSCFTGALTKYHEINHALPEKIIVYRDGVGDGQLDTVAGHEVEQFYAAFGGFQDDYRPKLSVVVVQKRINTKLFMKTPKGLDNPPPGSVMDHTVTKRDYYDFLLISQHVRQGTVTPTHYVCVHDDLQLPPNHMQRLAYKMTHMYYNWPGTVRVPAPCQYAHKLAYMTGQNICRTPHISLSDKLFYL